MRKIFAVILTAVILLGVTACGEFDVFDEPDVGDDDPVVPFDEPEIIPEPEIMTEPEPDPDPEPEPEPIIYVTPEFETVSTEDVLDMLKLTYGFQIPYRFLNEFTDINSVSLEVFLDYIWVNNRFIRNTHTPNEEIIGENCVVNEYGFCCHLASWCALYYKPEVIENILKTYINPNLSIMNYNFNDYSTESWGWEWDEETGLFFICGYTGPNRSEIYASPIIEDVYFADDIYYLEIVEAYFRYESYGKDIRIIRADNEDIGSVLSDEYRWGGGLWTPKMLDLNEAYNDVPRYLYTFRRNADGLMNIYSRELAE
ncbi:MAG: hypothetical protein FWD48_00445 [Oscillospiraceae bacterium]|nr:hypothetical protein [Oscillospiraceae bacterium]